MKLCDAYQSSELKEVDAPNFQELTTLLKPGGTICFGTLDGGTFTAGALELVTTREVDLQIIPFRGERRQITSIVYGFSKRITAVHR